MKTSTILTLIFSSLTLLSYFLLESLLEKMWILAYIPVLVFSITTIVFFVFEVLKRNRFGIVVFVVTTLIISSFEVLKSDLLKGKIILKAHLHDDLSGLDLILRDDNTFEMISTTIFTENVFEGKYLKSENKIIFKDRPYDNDFIPDTLTISNDTIYFRFDSNGKPMAVFADYFLIE